MKCRKRDEGKAEYLIRVCSNKEIGGETNQDSKVSVLGRVTVAMIKHHD